MSDYYDAEKVKEIARLLTEALQTNNLKIKVKRNIGDREAVMTNQYPDVLLQVDKCLQGGYEHGLAQIGFVIDWEKLYKPIFRGRNDFSAGSVCTSMVLGQKLVLRQDECLRIARAGDFNFDLLHPYHPFQDEPQDEPAKPARRGRPRKVVTEND